MTQEEVRLRLAAFDKMVELTKHTQIGWNVFHLGDWREIADNCISIVSNLREELLGSASPDSQPIDDNTPVDTKAASFVEGI